jgi:hypothetical protein
MQYAYLFEPVSLLVGNGLTSETGVLDLQPMWSFMEHPKLSCTTRLSLAHGQKYLPIRLLGITEVT